MSGKRDFKPKPPPWPTGVPLPAACDAHDLARIFNKALSTIYGWEYAGKLRRFQLGRPLGAKKWSGRLLQAYLDGEETWLEAVRRRA